jgi:hypothetical protein
MSARVYLLGPGDERMTRSIRRPARAGALSVALGLLAASLSADTLVFRNGQAARGRVVAVRGDIVEFQDARDGRTRRFDRREVRTIEFDEYSTYDRPAAPGNPYGEWGREASAAPPAGMREREVLAYAHVPWSDTGIDVRQGQTVYFRSRGEVRWGRDREDGPAGEKNSPRNPNRPMPNRPGAALVGKVGADPSNVFFIGADTGPIRMRASGRLFLGINDDYLQDNRGFFTVLVSY